jgi:hypothetical protein
MGSYDEYLIDSRTNWQEVQNQIAAALPQVQNPVNDVKVPTLTDLSGGFATGIGTYGNTYGIPPAPPEPINTIEAYQEPPPAPVKVPERDVVSLAQESISAETITNLLFENVGANELTKFVRHDTVEGINPYYDVISNLSDIKRKFDPSNLISLQKTTSSLFDIFPIKLQDKIPSDAYLLENNLTNFVYIDTNGDLVIEVVNLKDSEIVEIEIDTSGTIFEVDES